MSGFDRRGHWRTNSNGTTFWVRSHMVHRDHWDLIGLRGQSGSSVYIASDFLRRNNVGLGKQGCFVNPNARCPVCNIPVFFYANAHGSRVYFDDLGPPWPKHPCTDNPKSSHLIKHPNWQPISRRGKGLTQEIITAANIAGLLHRKLFGVTSINEWQILMIEQITRIDEKNELNAIVIDSIDLKYIKCVYYSKENLLNIGDFIYVKGKDFSFFSQEKMIEYYFSDGGQVFCSEKDIIAAPSRVDNSTTSSFDFTKFNKTDWTLSDERHFHTKRTKFKDFINRYVLVIDRYVEQGASSSNDFSKMLSAAHYRTAVGAQWTPRLTNFLIYFVLQPTTDPYDMQNHESKHFNSPKTTLEKLLKTARPVIDAANKDGIILPQDIADYMNRNNLKTAMNALWTPRLAGFLLALIGRNQSDNISSTTPIRHKSSKIDKKVHNATRNRTKQLYTDKSLNQKEQFAEMLSKLGKVSFIKRDIT